MRVSLLSLLVVVILCSASGGFLASATSASVEQAQNPAALQPYQPTVGADGRPLPTPLAGGPSTLKGAGAKPKAAKAPTAPGAKKAYYNVRQTDVNPNAPKANRGQFAKKVKPAAPLPPVKPPTPAAVTPAAAAPVQNYGAICDRNEDCRGGLTCEYEIGSNSKYCRDHILRLGAACRDDSRCPQGSICLVGASGVGYCTTGVRASESGSCRKTSIKDKTKYVCIDKKVQPKTAANAALNGKGCDCSYNNEATDCPTVKDGAREGQYECGGMVSGQYTCQKKW